ncbi:hypothetical protein BGZ97_004391, partial [Linnemannia gamsii]
EIVYISAAANVLYAINIDITVIRQFVASNYTAVKAANPNLPILIREAKGAEAKIFARFEHGQEKKIVLDGLSAKEIEQKLATLVK